MKVLLPLFVLLSAMFGTALLVLFQPEAEEVAVERPITSVEVITAQPEPVQLKVRSQGTVLPQTEVDLFAEVSGTIIEVAPSFRTGAEFRKGQILLQIDPVDYEAVVAARKADLATARLSLSQEEALAQQASQDWEALGQGEASELTLRKPQLKQAQAAVSSAEAQLAQAERNLERTQIRAPFDGRILTKSADLGQYIAASANPIARIYAVDHAEVRLPLTEIEASYLDLANDLPARVEFRPTSGAVESTWTGRLDRIEGTIDPQSRLLYAVAVLDANLSERQDEKPGLRRGRFVEAIIAGRTLDSAYSLPRYALRDSDTVYIATTENTLVSRQVDVVKTNEDRVIIQSGIQPGEQIVVSPIAYFVENMPISLITSE